MDEREANIWQTTSTRTCEPQSTEPIGEGARMAAILSYDENGNDLVRTIQVLQEGLDRAPSGWSWEPEDIAESSDTIDVSTANRFSNRLAEDGLVTVQPEKDRPHDAFDAFLPDVSTYALTSKGADFASALMYRYARTIKTDVFAYGCPDEDVVREAYEVHMGMDLDMLKRRYNNPRTHSGTPFTLQRLHFPPDVYEQYGI